MNTKEDPVVSAAKTPKPIEPHPRIQSKELFRNTQRVDIEHRGEIYHLQITRHGKLILTK